LDEALASKLLQVDERGRMWSKAPSQNGEGTRRKRMFAQARNGCLYRPKMDECHYVSICKRPKRIPAETVAQKGRETLVSIDRGNILIKHSKIKFERCGPSNPKSFYDYISSPSPLLVIISHSLCNSVLAG